jgi:Tol biopolymer transport system component
MKRAARLLLAFALVVAAMATASPVGAKTPGPNGQIAFTRYDSSGEAHIFIANPNGTHEHPLPLPTPADVAVWSPDGSKLVVFPHRADAPARPATVNPDGSSFMVLEVPRLPRDIDLVCPAWSPDGARLLCQASRGPGADPGLNGIYTIRASDGGGLRRLTVNPYPPSGNFGGGDNPGDFSPDGRRFVFMRARPGPEPTPDIGQRGALFVGNPDGTGLRQITPYGLANSHGNGLARWSPDGSRILFASERGSLFTIRPDGTGLRKIPLETGAGRSFAATPGWSPNGRRIVFSLFHEQTEQEDIYTARSDGRQVARVTDTSEFEDFGDWGPSPLAARGS